MIRALSRILMQTQNSRCLQRRRISVQTFSLDGDCPAVWHNVIVVDSILPPPTINLRRVPDIPPTMQEYFEFKIEDTLNVTKLVGTVVSPVIPAEGNETIQANRSVASLNFGRVPRTDR